MSGFTETPSEPDLCVSTYPALRIFLSLLLSVVRTAFGCCTVCSSFMLTTENLRPLALHAAFPHSMSSSLLPCRLLWTLRHLRSEERRVGKECRSQWSLAY